MEFNLAVPILLVVGAMLFQPMRKVAYWMLIGLPLLVLGLMMACEPDIGTD